MSTGISSGGLRCSMTRADNLTTFMCRFSRNSGNHNVLEPKGPVQACNGIPLGFTLSQATKALRESRGIALLHFRPLH